MRRDAFGDEIAEGHDDNRADRQKLVDGDGLRRGLHNQENPHKPRDDRRNAREPRLFAKENDAHGDNNQRNALHDRRKIGQRHVHQRRDKHE